MSPVQSAAWRSGGRRLLLTTSLALTLLTAWSHGPAGSAPTPPACSPTHLAPFEYVQMVHNTTQVTVNFVNDFHAVCVLRGYPSVSLFDSTGRLHTSAVHAARTLNKVVTLPPNGSAGFVMWFTNQPVADVDPVDGCPRASHMLVTITTSLHATLTSPFMINTALCDGGVVHVTPLQHGVPQR
jgi:hypothetical protein